MCHLHPALLLPLIQVMGVMVLTGDRTNPTHRKDMEAEACSSVSDDAKHGVATARLLPAELGSGQLVMQAAVLNALGADNHAVDAALLLAVFV